MKVELVVFGDGEWNVEKNFGPKHACVFCQLTKCN